MRITWPTGSWSGKRVLATVAPSKQTFSDESTSRAVKFAPSLSTQLRTSTYSSLPPSTEVFQFWFPATTWARPRTTGLHLPTVGSCEIAIASSMVKVVVVPEPPRTPPPPRFQLPDET